jgi:hypothetical protein
MTWAKTKCSDGQVAKSAGGNAANAHQNLLESIWTLFRRWQATQLTPKGEAQGSPPFFAHIEALIK